MVGIRVKIILLHLIIIKQSQIPVRFHIKREKRRGRRKRQFFPLLILILFFIFINFLILFSIFINMRRVIIIARAEVKLPLSHLNQRLLLLQASISRSTSRSESNGGKSRELRGRCGERNESFGVVMREKSLSN
uniref:Transmembrane protein n=1 Tax=Opuntia streptacantha TaxID=393608 RepID=A0A7C9AYK3_OPUST